MKKYSYIHTDSENFITHPKDPGKGSFEDFLNSLGEEGYDLAHSHVDESGITHVVLKKEMVVRYMYKQVDHQ